MRWVEVDRSDTPDPREIRWDVPPQNQGQIIEVAYGGPKTSPDEHCPPWAKWKRVYDRSDRTVTYYRRIEDRAMDPNATFERILDLLCNAQSHDGSGDIDEDNSRTDLVDTLRELANWIDNGGTLPSTIDIGDSSFVRFENAWVNVEDLV